MSMKGIPILHVDHLSYFIGHPKLMFRIYSHISEKAIRRRYGRSPRNVRAFIYLYNRLGHRGISALCIKYYE